MMVKVIFIVWICISLICAVRTAKNVRYYGSVELATRASSNVFWDLLSFLGIGLMFYLSYLLLDSGFWWLPICLQLFIIGPVIRGIYNI